MDIFVIISIALVAEAIWETLKMVWQDGKVSVDRVGAILVSILVVVATGADLFIVIGLPLNVPLLGSVLTGLLVSRGANVVHDLYTRIAE